MTNEEAARVFAVAHGWNVLQSVQVDGVRKVERALERLGAKEMPRGLIVAPALNAGGAVYIGRAGRERLHLWQFASQEELARWVAWQLAGQPMPWGPGVGEET